MAAVVSTFVARITHVLSLPPEERTEFDKRQVSTWLRSKVRYFRDATDDAMIKLVSECQAETKEANEIIILEGDVGDRMYIVLSGNVDIHRMNETDKEDDEEALEAEVAKVKKKIFVNRTPLGPCLATMSVGRIFGEVALIEACRRTASCIAGADGPCQLAVVNRELYNKTVRALIELEFQTKMDFINSVPYFVNCNPRYKKQLLMAFERHHYDYDCDISRQGEPVKNLYFVLDGEVRLSCDPSIHMQQYTQKMPEEDKQLLTKLKDQGTGYLRPTRHLEVCLLRVSDSSKTVSCFCDAEVLLGLDTNMMTATATTKTTVISLSIRHVERYIIRRNLTALDQMRRDLVPRLECWIRRYNSVYFFEYALAKVKDAVMATSSSSEFKTARVVYNPLTASPVPVEKFTLPPRGALVDLYGPGTAFGYIRHKYAQRLKTAGAVNARLRRYAPSGDVSAVFSAGPRSAQASSRGENYGFTSSDGESKRAATAREGKRSRRKNESVTSSGKSHALESRLSSFLGRCGGSSSYKSQVHPLYRYHLDETKTAPKAGNFVVLRPVTRHIEGAETNDNIKKIKNMFSEMTVANGAVL